MKKAFEWNKEAIDYFKLKSNEVSERALINLISKFVKEDCECEDGELPEELEEDIFCKVFNLN